MLNPIKMESLISTIERKISKRDQNLETLTFFINSRHKYKFYNKLLIKIFAAPSKIQPFRQYAKYWLDKGISLVSVYLCVQSQIKLP